MDLPNVNLTWTQTSAANTLLAGNGGILINFPTTVPVYAAAGAWAPNLMARRTILKPLADLNGNPISNGCNSCHGNLGWFTGSPLVGGNASFHSGQRNDPASCSFCHNTTSTDKGFDINIKDWVHGLHSSAFRNAPYTVQPNFPGILYPAILNDCEICHVDGSYDFSTPANANQVPNMLWDTVATGTPIYPVAAPTATTLGYPVQGNGLVGVKSGTATFYSLGTGATGASGATFAGTFYNYFPAVFGGTGMTQSAGTLSYPAPILSTPAPGMTQTVVAAKPAVPAANTTYTVMALPTGAPATEAQQFVAPWVTISNSNTNTTVYGTAFKFTLYASAASPAANVAPFNFTIAPPSGPMAQTLTSVVDANGNYTALTGAQQLAILGTAGNTYTTAPATIPATVSITGTAANQAPAGTNTYNNVTSLVVSPLTAACTGCHTSQAAISHMTLTGGGTFYQPRSSAYASGTTNLVSNEQCLVCHGPGTVGSIKAVHTGNF